MICYECGREVKDDLISCPHCGAPFEDDTLESEDEISQEYTTYAEGDLQQINPVSPIGTNANQSIPPIKAKTSALKVINCVFLGGIFLALLFFILWNIKKDLTPSEKSNRMLMVSFVTTDSYDKVSDYTQIENALQNGGMIRIDSEDLDSKLVSEMEEYGATDVSGTYYTVGALLNYISSRGWELVETGTAGLSSREYYFCK